ncbi:hypothetical protein BLA34_22020 [Ralstonia solanacearum]|nr:hypothetical protein BLA34_22020 [Ralstonia solanacearum]
MQEFQQIDAQIAHCEQEIAALTEAKTILLAQREEALLRVQEAELPAILAKIKELGFSKAQLGFDSAKKAKSADTGPKKYRDPETGEEWSGQGNNPKWMGGKDKEQFLNPAWEEHKNKKKGGGKAKSSEPVAQTGESTKPVDSTAQTQTSASVAPPVTTAATAAPEAPTSQNMAPAVNTAPDQDSVSTPANPAAATTAPIAIIAATSVAETSAINANAASRPAMGAPTVDTGAQPLAAAA